MLRTPAPVAASTARLPLSFEPTPRGYLARGAGFAIGITSQTSILALRRAHGAGPETLVTRLLGAARARPQPSAKLQGVVNEYGGPRSSWRTGVPTFGRLRYPSVYPGIDLVYHGSSGRLEYDFDVAPGADPSRIRLALNGRRTLEISPGGDLVIRLPGGTLRELRPLAFQTSGAHRIAVRARYVLSHGQVAFRLGRYDASKPLVVDPLLSYSSYIGGSAADQPQRIALDASGNVYIAGYTQSNDFPSATPRTSRTDKDAFVTELNSTGTSVIYSTYIESSDRSAASDDQANAIAIDGFGRAYVVGSTGSTVSTSSGFPEVNSTNYPALASCATGGTDAWMAQLAASTGTISYSSCLGSGSANGVAVRTSGFAFGALAVYVVGNTSSSGFPVSTNTTTTSAAQQSTYGGSGDGFVQRINFKRSACPTTNPPAASAPCVNVTYSSFVGSNNGDSASDVAVMPDPTTSSTTDVFVVGTSQSDDQAAFAFLPADPGTMPVGSGFPHAFVGAYQVPSSNASATKVYGYLYGSDGGSDDGRGIAIQTSGSPGRAFIVGSANGNKFPGAATTGDLVRGSGVDGFLAAIEGPSELNPGYVLYSDYVGGPGTDHLNDVALQNASTAALYAVGDTDSTMPTHNAVSGQSCASGDSQAVALKFMQGASPGPNDIYATCLGGSSAHGDSATGVAVDSSGGAWITGDTGGFPVTGDAFQATPGGGSSDGFFAHLTQPVPSISAGPSGIVNSTSAHFSFSTEAGTNPSCSTETAGALVAGTRSTNDCASATTADYSNLAQGPQTFEVAAIDGAGASSPVASQSFTVDTVPPNAFDLTSPDDGATVGAQPTFSWAQTSDDTSAVSYQLLIDGKKLQDVPASACDGTSCTAQAVTPLVGGTHTWSVTALDSSNPPNQRASSSTRTITVSNPPTAKFTIAPNPALVGRSVSFDASASADSSHTITHYEWDLDGDGTYETDTGSTPTVAKVFSKAGTINVGLRVTDSAGQQGTSTQSLKISDLTSTSGAPIGVSINHGDQYTNHTDVTLTVVSPAGSTALLVSNDGGFVDAKTFPVASGSAFAALAQTSQEIAWTLDSAGPERLPKTVYVRFVLGTFQSPNYTDDIILDTRPPVVQSASVVGGATGASVAALRKWKVRVKAKDDNSGVGGVQVAVSKRRPGRLINYTPTVTAKLGARPQFVRARDRAGNFSPWKKLR